MLLRSTDRTEFELRIQNYEFPKIEREKWDSNWLLINIRVKAPHRSWSATDPSLLKKEAVKLSQWLKACSHKKYFNRTISFIEPNLKFEIVSISEDYLTLRVYFELESHPPRNHSTSTLDANKCFVDLEVTREDLALAAEALEAELSRFSNRPKS